MPLYVSANQSVSMQTADWYMMHTYIHSNRHSDTKDNTFLKANNVFV